MASAIAVPSPSPSRRHYSVSAFQHPDFSRSRPRSFESSCCSSPRTKSPGSLARDLHHHLELSAASVPDSFHSYTLDTRGRAPSESGPPRQATSPVLTFRRVSSAASLGNIDLGETAVPRRHRRASIASSTSSSPPSPGIDESADMGSDSDECARHHHRESTGSIISIKCSSGSTSSSTSPSSPGSIEAAIPLAELDGDILVPLISRESEMADLLASPHNALWCQSAMRAVGRDVWEKKCLPLWTSTGRDEVADSTWLRESRELLSRGGSEGWLWSEFCQIVGWDGEEIPEEFEEVAKGKRSHESLRMSCADMGSIREDEEEEG